MTKGLVAAIFVLMLVGVFFLATHLKDAYRVLPVVTSNQLEAPTFADWREFTASSGRFKVELPAFPQYAKEAVNIPNTDKKRRYEMYVSQKINGSVFMINLITYPEDIDTSNTDQMLQSIVDEMVSINPGNQLKEVHHSLFQTYQAIGFHIANKDFDVQGKAFMVQKTMYLLTYVAKLSDFSESEFQYFLNSFQLLPNAEKKVPLPLQSSPEALTLTYMHNQ